MIDTMDLSDALADEIAAQRQAASERCGITITAYVALTEICNGLPSWGVTQDGNHLGTFFFEDQAYTFAYEMANEQIEAEII